MQESFSATSEDLGSNSRVSKEPWGIDGGLAPSIKFEAGIGISFYVKMNRAVASAARPLPARDCQPGKRRGLSGAMMIWKSNS